MRLIDADALKKDLTRFYGNEVTAKELIDEQPTVDAVPVVRCEDCRWYDKGTASGTYEPVAYKCKLHQRFTLGNMFCSDGEKHDA